MPVAAFGIRGAAENLNALSFKREESCPDGGVSFSMEGCLLVFSAVLIELQPASASAEAAKRAKDNLFFTIFSCKENFTVMQSPKTLCRGYPY